MWIVVFVVLAVFGLVVLGLLAWRTVRRAGSLLAEVSEVLDRLSAVVGTMAEFDGPEDRDDRQQERARTGHSRPTAEANPERRSAT